MLKLRTWRGLGMGVIGPVYESKWKYLPADKLIPETVYNTIY